MEFTIQAALDQGIAAHKAGKLSDADRFYTAILKVDPTHPDANHNLGVLAVSVNKATEALIYFKRAIETRPGVEQYWLSLIDACIQLEHFDDAIALLKKAHDHGHVGQKFDALEQRLPLLDIDDPVTDKKREPSNDILNSLIDLYQSGKIEEALEKAQKVLKAYPNSFNLNNLIGVLHATLKQYDASMQHYKKAIKIKPDFADVHCNIGVILRETGKIKEALTYYKRAIQLKSDYPEAYYNMGNALNDVDALDAAIESFNKAIDLNASYAEAYYNLANVQVKKNEFEDAIPNFKKALEIKPNNPDVLNNLGNAYRELGLLSQAKAAYLKVLAVNPENDGAHSNLGVTLNGMGKFSEGVKHLKKAVKINSRSASAYNNLGNAYQSSGAMDDAILSYQRAISLKPDLFEAHRHLSSLLTYTEETPHFLDMKSLEDKGSLSEKDLCALKFALAKAYEDIGSYDLAYEYYSAGNKLRKSILGYNILQDIKAFEILKDRQPRISELELSSDLDYTGPIPIFILGMPRSGTTLIEQIISSHSKVSGGGELDYVFRYAKGIFTDVETIDGSAIVEFRKSYLNDLKKVSYGKPYVTDKMPQNFKFIPLILSAIPEAKIIHVYRDPAATCWSNYKHYFSTTGLGYSYDLTDVVAYYRLYRDLMNTWDTEYPGKIIQCSYDALTISQEQQTKDLIEHLELSWESSCLKPQDNKRNIRTASQRQVRNEVYKGSSQGWKKYEKYLNKALEGI